ncbi:MAG: anthrone oxygenase family protein [Blastocatellia bacterium]
MEEHFPKVLLWLFVINLGIVFGAGLYEARIAFPQWLVYSAESGYRWNAEAARQANTGLRFWVYVTTGPLTLLTLANLVAAWRAHGTIRGWWLSAAVAALADRIFTFSYFVPTMVKLMSDENLSQSQAVAMASRWGQLNYLRHLFVLGAWVLALRAFSLLGKN